MCSYEHDQTIGKGFKILYELLKSLEKRNVQNIQWELNSPRPTAGFKHYIPRELVIKIYYHDDVKD